eukprot:2154785-Rhodomonas_salina.2
MGTLHTCLALGTYLTELYCAHAPFVCYMTTWKRHMPRQYQHVRRLKSAKAGSSLLCVSTGPRTLCV